MRLTVRPYGSRALTFRPGIAGLGIAVLFVVVSSIEAAAPSIDAGAASYTYARWSIAVSPNEQPVVGTASTGPERLLVGNG
jgi:hypothetical protein